MASAEKYGDKEGFLVFYRVLFPIGVSQTLSRFKKTYDEVHIWIGVNVFFQDLRSSKAHTTSLGGFNLVRRSTGSVDIGA